MNHALNQIRQAGFSLELDIAEDRNIMDGFFIEPSDKLTAPQLAYLKTHKAEIIAALKRERRIKPKVKMNHVLHFKLTDGQSGYLIDMDGGAGETPLEALTKKYGSKYSSLLI